MLSRAEPAARRLVDLGDPAVARMARRDLLGEDVDPDGALGSPLVRGLLDGQEPGGAAPDAHPYRKWTGTHWRLISLVELELPVGHPTGVAMCDAVLDHWAGPRRLAAIPVLDGRARRCASQEGNAVAVACRLGLAHDARVRALVDHLVTWQWPDGGWNCDIRPEANHSSFHETLPALRGLTEYAARTDDPATGEAADRAAELLLRHEVIFSTRTDEPVDPSFTVPHFPPYWHYDVLQALLVLDRAGCGGDPRTERARRLVADRRLADGWWRAGRRWWRPPGSPGSGVEAVDWGAVADEMVTLNALRVGAGRA